MQARWGNIIVFVILLAALVLLLRHPELTEDLRWRFREVGARREVSCVELVIVLLALVGLVSLIKGLRNWRNKP